ncbi:MAG: anti-sigma factor [Chloroflexota bacterium]
MDHDDALEALQLAAAEPGGLERLMAGDTPQAAALVGHLAGCDACSTELERLRRGVPMLRDVVRTTPSPDLRERTLAYVREEGIARPLVAATASASAEPVAIPVAAGAGAPAVASRAGRRSVLPWVASIAAAVVLSVLASTFIIGTRVDQQLAAQDRAIAGLEAVTSATLAITAEPDAERVSLASTDGSPIYGSLLFSPSTTELVVVADGLSLPPEGQEYRCWLLVDGTRTDVGKMFFADDLAFWAGDTPEVASVSDGTTFGVSLTEVDAPSLDGDPIIVGQL